MEAASAAAAAAAASSQEASTNPWKFPSIKIVAGSYIPQHHKGGTKGMQGGTKGTQWTQSGGTTYYGVYFYPFTKPGDDPVFAIVGGLEVLIVRAKEDDGFDVIQFFKDDCKYSEAFCTACWTKDKESGDPLLAVGGQGRVIKVLNVVKGTVIQTLMGHGDEIMQIALHPCDQNIVASAGADSSVRFWSLDPKHCKQPCLLICAGEGHRETILSIAFHSTGRYLLSGGMDHMVNLWVIPDIPDKPTDEPITLVYPHFSTSVLHDNYVDCLAFYGDYILSRACREEKIVLWAIQNFSSKVDPPAQEQAPTTHEWRPTRSAWGPGFDRILQFSCPDTMPFYMRFGFYAQPGMHPVLAIGSTKGKIYMWDLVMIEQHGRGTNAPSKVSTPENSILLPDGAKLTIKRDDVTSPFAKIRAHTILETQKVKTTIRDIAFSTDGSYMMFVGEGSMIGVCKRW